MFDAKVTPIELCKWFVPHLARSMRLTDCDELDETYTFGPYTISFKSNNDDKDGDQNLPRKVRRGSDKLQDVFRAFDSIWNAPGREPGQIMPKQILSWLRAEYGREPDPLKQKHIGRSTVHHMLTELQEMGFVHQHADGGWMRGERPAAVQGPLFDDDGVPTAEGTHSPLEQAATNSNASPVGDVTASQVKPAAPKPGAREMPQKKQIWVPGEKDEWTDGLVVTDADGNTHLAEGDQKRVRYVGRTGRPVAPMAVLCDLVGVDDEGRYQVATVVVKTPEGRKQVRVRALGDWQLAGLMSDREELANSN